MLTDASGAGRILYVDDEVALLALVTRVLSRRGWEVVGHEDPRAALEDFRSRPDAFALVVVDVAMPHLSGFGLLNAIRAIRPGQRAVVASGLVTEQDVAAAERLGNVRLLTKSSSIDQFAEALLPELLTVSQGRS